MNESQKCRTIFRPVDVLTDADIARGLRAGHFEAVFSISMLSLVSGAFLSGWALKSGASMTYIGLLNAAGAAAIVIQFPAIWMAAQWPRRKLLWGVTQLTGRLIWLLLALLPLFVSSLENIRAISLVLVYAGFMFLNVAGPAWTSWLRDFIPEERMGRHLGSRMATGLITGSAVGILGGFLVDYFKDGPRMGGWIYNALFALASLAGLAGVFFGLRQPEPRVEKQGGSLYALLMGPLRDLNFRRYIYFMLAWGFAGFLALPFTMAYMLSRLGFDMRWAVGMAMLSQIMTALFMPMWGRLSDRFTSKSVLSIACPMFLMAYPLWLLSGNVESEMIRYGIVIALHLIFGLASGGMAVATGNLVMKFAPRGKAAAYSGLNATTTGLTAIVSPWLAGLLADRLKEIELTFSISFTTPSLQKFLPVITLEGLDYLFILAFMGGLYGWHRLLAVEEQGEVEEEVILGAMMSEMLGGVRLAGHHAKRGFRKIAINPWGLKRAATGDPVVFGEASGQPEKHESDIKS